LVVSAFCAGASIRIDWLINLTAFAFAPVLAFAAARIAVFFGILMFAAHNPPSINVIHYFNFRPMLRL